MTKSPSVMVSLKNPLSLLLFIFVLGLSVFFSVFLFSNAKVWPSVASEMSSPVSRLDTVYRSLLLSRFFTKGWGKPEHLKRIFELRRQLGKRSVALAYVDPNHSVTITRTEVKSDHKLLEGYFTSPFAQYLPDLIPEESVRAHFQVVLPTKWPDQNHRPMCIQYAGTGKFKTNNGVKGMSVFKIFQYKRHVFSSEKDKKWFFNCDFKSE